MSTDISEGTNAESTLPNGRPASSERYTYQPLKLRNEFRLLQIRPSDDQTAATADGSIVLDCELKHTTLDTAPKYFPVSYVWGDLNETQPFVLVHDQHVEISTSLYIAIHTLYKEMELDWKVLHLWADQICIDQRNWTERSEQVKIMGEIFAGGHRTLVWLGEPDDSTRAVSKFIFTLYHSRLTLQKAKDLFDKRNSTALRGLLDIWQVTDEEIENGTAAIVRLADRPWFTRLWTFQELVVSPRLEFYCGTHRWSRHEPLIAFYATRLLRRVRSTGMYHGGCLSKYHYSFRKRQQRPLLQLLSDVIDSGYQCTELNDRIYAVLGLHTESHDIPVDYNMSIETLMYLTAKSIISYSGNLDALCRRRTSNRAHLPSWVPDWTSPTFQWSINDRRVKFHASQNHRYQFEESGERILLTRGKAITHISEIINHSFPDHMSSGDENDLLSHLMGAHSVVRAISTRLAPLLLAQGIAPDSLKAHTNRLIALTLSGGRLQKSEDPSTTPEFGDDIDENARLARLILSQEISDRKALTKCKGRKVAILASTRSPLALVPDCARAGDVVVVLDGCATPLVLRRDGEYYENQSECYVHGIMYGEAVDWEEGAGEVFRIR